MRQTEPFPLLPEEPSRRVRAMTCQSSCYLCPELLLHLITPDCPLWHATPDDLESLGLEAPYWAFAWPGGQLLARFLLDHPEWVRDKRVLDFGAGGGVEALAAARAGAAHVLAADIDPLAVTALQLNAALNGVSLEVTEENLIGVRGGWDVVLVGDVLYEAALSEKILTWLEELASAGAQILIGDPNRGFLPERRLEILLEQLAPADVDLKGLFMKPTRVGRLLPSTPAG